MDCFKSLIVGLLFVAGSLSAAPIGDSLWVVRSKADSTVTIAFERPFTITYDVEGKMTISCGSVVRGRLGNRLTLAFRPRAIGVDTSRFEIAHTTLDTLPGSFRGGAKYTLPTSGKFRGKP